MASRTFILFAGHREPWRVAVDSNLVDVPAEDGALIECAVELAAESLKRAGYRGESVLLAIPSAWCFAGSIALADLPRARHDRGARLFRLEEKLPLAAEELVADFVDAGERSLGVCARLDHLRPVVDALESKGVAVERIAPTALLAAQATPPAHAPAVHLVNEEDVVNVITIDDAGPIAWSVAPASDVDLHVVIARQSTGATEVRPLTGKTVPTAAMVGRTILRGRMRPWVDLRRDALASPDRLRGSRRALNAVLAAAAMLLLALGAVMLMRGQRYDTAARDDERQVAALFRVEFPGWTMPANVSAVIDSEHRKITAQQLGAARQASSESALRTLVRVLGSLPPGTRLVLERMTFDDHGFVLDGRIAAPAELDAITAAVRSANLRVAPPQAQRDETGGTWHFTLRGELAPSSASPATPLAEVSP